MFDAADLRLVDFEVHDPPLSLRKNVRYTRHELKQDKFAERTADAVHWTVEHRSKIINISIAVAVILALALGGWWYMNRREAQAQVALGQALLINSSPLRPESIPADPNVPSFTSVAERAKAAKEAFNKVADQYGSTRSGQFAQYFAALAEQDLGNTQAAEQQLKATADSRNADVASLSKFALSTLYGSSNREADAVRLLKELIDKPTMSVPKVTAQLQLAELYEPKQPQEARKIYEQIAKEDPKGMAGQVATQKTQQLAK